MTSPLLTAFGAALDARAALPGPEDRAAMRLFSGFYEGYPALSVDLYGRTALLHDHGTDPAGDETAARAALGLLRERLPWVRAAVWKIRKSPDAADRQGRLLLGELADLDTQIVEDGVRYALDLRLTHDASFYLDTRPLRAWLRANLAGKTALNTFAYTGSLGVAALAGGARRVVQLDRSRAALDVARRSCDLNGLKVARGDLVAADFFEHVGRLKTQNALFDCVVVDPPFFASSDRGRVDLQGEAQQIINKVRPLVGDGGVLVVVNNALYMPGSVLHEMLLQMCASGYLTIEALMPIREEITGFASTRQGTPPAAPAPFNHPTKIALLRVKRKDGRKAT